MIEADGLTFSYGTKRKDTPVVQGVSLRTRPGRVLGLIGPNGSGKTTVLRLLYGSLRPSAGEVRVDDRRLRDVSSRELARSVAVVVQEGGGDTTMTVAEMVLLGRTPHSKNFARLTEQDQRVATQSLQRVGALDLGPRAFAGLSGGEKQRVLIARALAQEAEHLLLDEPTNHLDIRYQHDVLRLVHTLGKGGIVVLHDLNLAARYCDDLVLLDRGTVARQGTVDEVLEPTLLERVYGIGVQRVEQDGDLHLLFHPGEVTCKSA
ncbi:MAG: ABC transporter ATP-binding protein [Ornithinimicrobium sp.]